MVCRCFASPSGHFDITEDGKELIVSFYRLPETNFITLAFVDKDHILAPLEIITRYGQLATLITMLLTSAIVYTVVNAVTKDIFKIADFAKKIGDGNLEEQLSINRNDELGTLAIALENMVSRLKSMIWKAEEATKAKSDFLARMSHEIRTPMNAIIGMAHIGLQSKPEEKQKKCFEKIQHAAGNLLGIINDILDFSKVEAGKLELEMTSFRLSGLIQSMSDLLEGKAKDKGINLSFTVAPDVPDALKGDSLRISQVCINLCTNALKFTEKGSVKVSVKTAEDRGESLLLEFQVQDTGIGLEKHQIAGIFDAFSQADGSTTRRFGGTGLGLTISQRLVHMMGGDIWVESTPNVGSIFYFTILVEKAELGTIDESKQSCNGEISKEDFKDIRVLLVDDNEINQEIGKELLLQVDINPTLANNGAEALEFCKLQAFDLVLMDIHMPIMDGLEATRRIRMHEGPLLSRYAHHSHDSQCYERRP